MATRAGAPYLPIRPAGHKPAPVPYFQELMKAQNMLPLGITALAASAGKDEKSEEEEKKSSEVAAPPPEEDPTEKFKDIKNITERVISHEVDKLPGGKTAKKLFNNVEIAADIIGSIVDPINFRGKLVELINANKDVRQINQNYINESYDDIVTVYRTVILQPGQKLATEGEKLSMDLYPEGKEASNIVSVSTDFETNIKQFADKAPITMSEITKGFQPFVIKYTIPKEKIIADVSYLSSLISDTEAMNKKFKNMGIANEYFDEKDMYGEYPEQRNRIKYARDLSNRQKEILVDVSGAEMQIIPTGRVLADSARIRIQKAIKTGDTQSLFDELEQYEKHEDYKNKEYEWSPELSKDLYNFNQGGIANINYLTRRL